jgi:hypothetical protein
MIFTSSLQGPIGNLGAAQLTADQQALLSSVVNLSAQEKFLRTMFTRVSGDIARLAQAKQPVGAGVMQMLQNYNNAVGAHRRAGMVWINARNAVPQSKLPDPGAKPLAIPSFDLPPAPAGLGGTVSAATIGVKYGYIGDEKTALISDFVRAGGNGFAGMPYGENFGNPFLVSTSWRVVATLFAMAITVFLITYAWDDFSGQRAKQQELESLNLQSDNLTKVVAKDFDLYQTALRACAGKDPDLLDFDQRLICIDKSNEALTLGKANRQGPGLPVNLSPMLTIALVGGLGVMSWIIYTSIKRKQRGSTSGYPASNIPSMRREVPRRPGPVPGRGRAVFPGMTADEEA